MWEDDRNKYGGRWLVNVDKKGPRPPIIDQYWMETVSDTPLLIFYDLHTHTTFL